MPMRAYRASAAYVGGHFSRNTWLWIVIFTVITAVLGLLRWGDLMAASAMLVGILIMFKGQEGYVPPDVAEEEVSPTS